MRKAGSLSSYNQLFNNLQTPVSKENVSSKNVKNPLIKPISFDKKGFVSEKRSIRVNYNNDGQVSDRSSRSADSNASARSRSSSMNKNVEKKISYGKMIIPKSPSKAFSPITSLKVVKKTNIDDVIKNEMLFKSQMKKDEKNKDKEKDKVDNISSTTDNTAKSIAKTDNSKEADVDMPDNAFFEELTCMYNNIGQVIEVST